MYIDLTAEQKKLQSELRRYFAELMTPDLEREVSVGEGGGPLFRRALKKLGTDGWIGIGWPKAYGGQGRSPIEQYLFADEAQRAALQTVFSGQAGGWPKRFGEMVQGEIKGFAFVPIMVEIAPDLLTWRAEVPAHNIAAAAEALMGPTSDGKVTKLHNLPGAETGPGGVATWGRATVDRADAFGFKWNRTGKSSKLIAFEWSGPD